MVEIMSFNSVHQARRVELCGFTAAIETQLEQALNWFTGSAHVNMFL